MKLKAGNRCGTDDTGFFFDPADEIAACRRCVLPECVEKNADCYLMSLRRSKAEERNVHIPSNMSVSEILKYVKPLTPLEKRLHHELDKLNEQHLSTQESKCENQKRK